MGTLFIQENRSLRSLHEPKFYCHVWQYSCSAIYETIGRRRGAWSNRCSWVKDSLTPTALKTIQAHAAHISSLIWCVFEWRCRNLNWKNIRVLFGASFSHITSHTCRRSSAQHVRHRVTFLSELDVDVRRLMSQSCSEAWKHNSRG